MVCPQAAQFQKVSQESSKPQGGPGEHRPSLAKFQPWLSCPSFMTLDESVTLSELYYTSCGVELTPTLPASQGGFEI